MHGPNWFEFKSLSENADAVDLYLYDEIGGWGASAAQFISALAEFKGQRVNLHIHSPGGSVFEGHAIFNALRNHPGGVTVYVDGIAASMASVIAMAGAPVKMASNAFLMIHNPWTSGVGDSEELRKQADVLDKLKESLVSIYVAKSGQPRETIAAAMDSETWLDAEEAVAFGLADEVFEGMAVAASIDFSRFSAKAPEGARVFAKPMKAQEIEQPEAAPEIEPAAEPEVAAATEVDPAPEVEAEAEVPVAAEPVAAVDLDAAMAEVLAKYEQQRQAAAQLGAEFARVCSELDAAHAAKVQAESRIAELEQALAAERESVNAKAAQIVAQAGHPPIALGARTETVSAPKGTSLLAQYNELRAKGSAAERLAFVRQHRNELFAAAKTKQ